MKSHWNEKCYLPCTCHVRNRSLFRKYRRWFSPLIQLVNLHPLDIKFRLSLLWVCVFHRLGCWHLGMLSYRSCNIRASLRAFSPGPNDSDLPLIGPHLISSIGQLSGSSCIPQNSRLRKDWLRTSLSLFSDWQWSKFILSLYPKEYRTEPGVRIRLPIPALTLQKWCAWQKKSDWIWYSLCYLSPPGYFPRSSAFLHCTFTTNPVGSVFDRIHRLNRHPRGRATRL